MFFVLAFRVAKMLILQELTKVMMVIMLNVEIEYIHPIIHMLRNVPSHCTLNVWVVQLKLFVLVILRHGMVKFLN